MSSIFLLILISSFTSVFNKDIDTISICYNSLIFLLWSNLEKFLCKKNVHYAAVGWYSVYMSIRFSWSIAFLNSLSPSYSAICIFYQLLKVGIKVFYFYCIAIYFSLQFCCFLCINIKSWVHMHFVIVISSWWIYPVITIQCPSLSNEIVWFKTYFLDPSQARKSKV